MVDLQRSLEVTTGANNTPSFSHPTVFKSIPFVSSRLRLTSRESAIRGLSVSEPEPSISETKPKSKTVTVLLWTIALDQSAGEKSPCHCKKSVVTNYFITLAEGSCNKTVRSRFHRFRGSAVCSCAD